MKIPVSYLILWYYYVNFKVKSQNHEYKHELQLYCKTIYYFLNLEIHKLDMQHTGIIQK